MQNIPGKKTDAYSNKKLGAAKRRNAREFLREDFAFKPAVLVG
jgi:hypothetical protein